MAKSWESFEDQVRTLASAIWGRPCLPTHIGGVDIDGMVEPDEDVKVFIEMTERKDLNKVREDVIKLRTAKSALLQETGAFARCFCIVNGTVTHAMKEAGEPHSIRVLSFDTFSRIFFDFDNYKSCRDRVAFGSAVDPITGEKDESQYVPVKYLNEASGLEIDVAGIGKLLQSGRHVVLLGEYGSGKSRCLRELFSYLSGDAIARQQYPIAIDLREAWGVKRGIELIRRHIEDIGADNLQAAAIRALNTNTLLLLFDGFDEIGSQAWSRDSDKLKAIRAKSLEGVKDLIDRSSNGIFISGREHYFNSSAEMISALGLDERRLVLLRCKTEFTEQETVAFFERLNAEVTVPEWLPRRPLICQTIAGLAADELDQMFGVGDDEIEFWGRFMRVLCERDARIHVSFDAVTIERILMYLSRLTRTRPANVGPLTLSDVQTAFETVVGQSPVEDASVMLQRLPGLGRVATDSNDRQFIDMYILDGLRAKDVGACVEADEIAKTQILSTSYINPLGALGQRVLAREQGDQVELLIAFAKRCFQNANVVLGCDIVSACLYTKHNRVDFSGINIVDGNFLILNMADVVALNISFKTCVFSQIILPSSPPPGTFISDCIAERVYGVASENALPPWITGFSAEQYDSVESISRIRRIGLEPSHEVLVAIVRKTFFQKGSGRKEEALTRGLNRVATQSMVDKVLALLMREGALERFKGNEGWVYTPNRSMAGRMKKMLYELRVSQDPLWIEVGRL